MSDLFIPINFSNLSKLIPEGEEIIYSTLCEVKFFLLKKKYVWKSHVLFTPNYVAFTHPEMKLFKFSSINSIFENGLILTIVELGLLEQIKTDSFIIIAFNFKLEREPNYESKDGFKERKGYFEYKILPYLVPAKKKILSYVQSNPNQQEYNKLFIKRLMRELPKLNKQS